MKHLFIPHELAIIAKEKGFNEPCLAYWNAGKTIRYGKYSSNQMYREQYLAPLCQQIIDWFLDKHDVDIQTHYNSNLTKKHSFQIHQKGCFCIVDSQKEFDTKKEMLNEAIQEAFKLI